MTKRDDTSPMLDFAASLQARTTGPAKATTDEPTDAGVLPASDAPEEDTAMTDPSLDDPLDLEGHTEDAAVEETDVLAGLLAQAGAADETSKETAVDDRDLASAPSAIPADTPDTEDASQDATVDPGQDGSADDASAPTDATPKTDAAPARETFSDQARRAKAAPRTEPNPPAPVNRIVLREMCLEIADRLDQGDIGRRTAARDLRAACATDARDLDIDDIEVDFDALPEERSGLALLAGLGMPKGKERASDPIEASLLAAMKLRDRSAALRIVGDTVGDTDRAAYHKALIALRDTLNTHLAD